MTVLNISGTVPIIHDDEAFLSVLKRLAAYHNFDAVSTMTMVFGAGGDVRGVPTGHQAEVLAEAMPEIAGALKRMGLPARENGHHEFYDSTAHRYHLRFDHVRFCPLCIAEAPYLRQAWHLAAVNVCHVHGVRLLNGCHCCGAKISWNRPLISSCTQCGAHFREASTTRADALELEAVQDLLALCRAPGVSSPTTIVPVLRTLNLGGAIELIMMVGRFACAIDGMKLGEGRPLTWPHASLLISKGYEVVKSWPHDFHDLLTRGLKRAKASDNLHAVFGASYKSLLRLSNTPWGQIVYPEFKAAVTAFRDAQLQSRHRCTMAGIRHEFGVKRHTLDRLRNQVSAKGWRSVGKKAQSDAILSTVVEHRAARAALCNLAEMGALLGLTTKAQIKKVADAGIIREVKPEHVSDRRSRYFAKAEIRSFLETVSFCSAEDNQSTRIARWGEVLRMAGQRKLTMGHVLRSLIQGELRPVRVETDVGLPGLVFCHADAKKALDAVVARLTDCLTVREVANRAGVSPRVAYKLVEEGHLEASAGERDEIRVPTTSVDRFLQRHMSVGELSQRLGVSKLRLKEKLQVGRRHQPSIALEKDGPQFFLRTEVL